MDRALSETKSCSPDRIWYGDDLVATISTNAEEEYPEEDYPLSNMFDGQSDTFWHSASRKIFSGIINLTINFNVRKNVHRNQII